MKSINYVAKEILDIYADYFSDIDSDTRDKIKKNDEIDINDLIQKTVIQNRSFDVLKKLIYTISQSHKCVGNAEDMRNFYNIIDLTKMIDDNSVLLSAVNQVRSTILSVELFAKKLDMEISSKDITSMTSITIERAQSIRIDSKANIDLDKLGNKIKLVFSPNEQPKEKIKKIIYTLIMKRLEKGSLTLRFFNFLETFAFNNIESLILFFDKMYDNTIIKQK